ncbi:ATP-binding cassette domain-containing protein [Mesomycoplasma neurolyticum]|uniref:ABC transporter ATP-binding protein n=1 Tax=Mesomycoplasma neurolyticum TaxID=2120 RepID=A0A449A551_9BACT|nr:ATP-binding cassette domain-containing protein [Mesomycoplasma neurolyticum]VEU59359.1 ABC transporter ATP-binding protein [Mesomycoplasma neurolyticum]
MKKIVINNVNASSKKDNEKLLYDLNLEIKENEFIAVIGSSGSGKTSFFNLIINELKILSGNIFFNNKNYFDFNKKEIKSFKQSVGYLNQKPNLLYEEDVYHNIKKFYNLQTNNFFKLFNIITQKDFDFIKGILKQFLIEDFIFTPVSNLSGGQQQRVEIAKLLIKKSQIILADEPTTGLDYKTSETVLKSLKTLSQLQKTITLVNIHDLSLISDKYFSRVIAFKKGRIALDISIDQFNLKTIKEKKIYE